jgi:diaminopimelate epimerase
LSDYFKYHGLGNDYLVLEPERFRAMPAPEAVRQICDRHRGAGADGLVWGPLPEGEPAGPLGVRIFNSDGSEAEQSGNGLRIFARHLWARRLARERTIRIAAPGGEVEARVLDEAGREIALALGTVRFMSTEIPMSGPAREVLGETLEAGGRAWTIGAANIGNPHCVVVVPEPTPELARRIGPLIEHHPAFPRRTNVQFMRVVGEQAIRIEIWERGAGHTSASGSSSCAAAAVACRLGMVRPPVTVHMPGGELRVDLDERFAAVLTGPVAAVAEGNFHEDFLAALGLKRR